MTPNNINEPNKQTMCPSLQGREDIFKMASDPKYFADFQKMLQTLDFDVNTEHDRKGNFLVHVVVQKDMNYLPLLMALVKTCGADIELGNADGMTPLMLAAMAGDCVLCDVLICLLEANVNKPNSQNGRTPLHYAVEGNHRKTVEYLIQRGANVNLEDHTGLRADDVPTCAATKSDCREIIEFNRMRRLEILSDSIKSGEISSHLQPSDLCVVDSDGNTLIMIAASHNQYASLQHLLDISKSTIDAQNTRTGMTALAMSARMDAVETALILLSHGSSLAIADMKGYLPLHHAVINNHEDVVSVFLDHFPNTYLGLHKAIYLCKKKSILAKLKLACKRRQEKIVTPKLLECSISGDARELFAVLDEADMIYQKGGPGIWPLYLAVENGHLDVLQLINEFGGDITQVHPVTGGTVLHVAAKMRHHSIVSYLLQFCRGSQRGCLLKDVGAASRFCQCHTKQKSLLDINAVDKSNKTALQLAAENGFSEIVQLLISHGASTSVLDNSGKLLTCPKFEGVQTALETHRLQHTLKIMNCIEENSKMSLSVLQKIWLPRFDHHLRNKEGSTPLMVAAKTGNVPVIKFLLESAVYPQLVLTGYDSGNCTDGDSDTDSGILDLPTRSVPDGSTIEEEFEFSFDGITGTLSAELNNEGRPDFLCCDLHRHSIGIIDTSKFYQRRLTCMSPEVSRQHRRSIYQNGLISHIRAINSKCGNNVLHYAIQKADAADILTLFLEHDSSPLNMQNDRGETVLHMACRLGRKKSVELLLAQPDLDLNIHTFDGHLPEDLTSSSAVQKLLKKRRAA